MKITKFRLVHFAYPLGFKEFFFHENNVPNIARGVYFVYIHGDLITRDVRNNQTDVRFAFSVLI